MMEFEKRRSAMWEEAEEARAAPDSLTITGLAAPYNSASLPMSFPFLRGGRVFREVIHPGAFTKSLSELPDMTLRWQHDRTSWVLGRTKSGTLRLTEGERGLQYENDLPDNEWGRPVRDTVLRRDVTGMSFAFKSAIDDWQEEKDAGLVRHLLEVRLGSEISLTDAPAYPDTWASIRHLAESVSAEFDALAEAFRILGDDTERLTTEQRDLLMAVVNARTDEPFVGPTLARARELLAARA